MGLKRVNQWVQQKNALLGSLLHFVYELILVVRENVKTYPINYLIRTVLSCDHVHPLVGNQWNTLPILNVDKPAKNQYIHTYKSLPHY